MTTEYCWTCGKVLVGVTTVHGCNRPDCAPKDLNGPFAPKPASSGEVRMTAEYAHSFDLDTLRCHGCGVYRNDVDDGLEPKSCSWSAKVVPIVAAAAATGLRYDTGKLRLDLIPPEWIEALAAVLTVGAVKYAPRNWEKGMAWSKVYGPLMRHVLAWLKGERDDPETKCHHLAHVAWNALALMVYEMRGLGEDDLNRGRKQDDRK